MSEGRIGDPDNLEQAGTAWEAFDSLSEEFPVIKKKMGEALTSVSDFFSTNPDIQSGTIKALRYYALFTTLQRLYKSCVQAASVVQLQNLAIQIQYTASMSALLQAVDVTALYGVLTTAATLIYAAADYQNALGKQNSYTFWLSEQLKLHSALVLEWEVVLTQKEKLAENLNKKKAENLSANASVMSLSEIELLANTAEALLLKNQFSPEMRADDWAGKIAFEIREYGRVHPRFLENLSDDSKAFLQKIKSLSPTEREYFDQHLRILQIDRKIDLVEDELHYRTVMNIDRENQEAVTRLLKDHQKLHTESPKINALLTLSQLSLEDIQKAGTDEIKRKEANAVEKIKSTVVQKRYQLSANSLNLISALAIFTSLLLATVAPPVAPILMTAALSINMLMITYGLYQGNFSSPGIYQAIVQTAENVRQSKAHDTLERHFKEKMIKRAEAEKTKRADMPVEKVTETVEDTGAKRTTEIMPVSRRSIFSTKVPTDNLANAETRKTLAALLRATLDSLSTTSVPRLFQPGKQVQNQPQSQPQGQPLPASAQQNRPVKPAVEQLQMFYEEVKSEGVSPEKIPQAQLLDRIMQIVTDAKKDRETNQQQTEMLDKLQKDVHELFEIQPAASQRLDAR